MSCPLQKKYGDVICIDGTLWGLTYSECAPPDQRQNLGACEYCRSHGVRVAEDLPSVSRASHHS